MVIVLGLLNNHRVKYNFAEVVLLQILLLFNPFTARGGHS